MSSLLPAPTSHLRRFLVPSAALIAACALGCGGDDEAPESTGDSATGASSAGSGGSGGGVAAGGEASGGHEEMPLACAPPGPSSCDNEASVIRGVARLAPGVSPEAGTAGRLVVALMHARFGKADKGGHPHWYEVIKDVDLAAGPVPFELDMCDGNAAMWSEDNCEFNLVVVLDTNANNGPSGSSLNLIPDPGEVGWHKLFDLSCKGQSECFDVQFDCLDGQPCIAYEDLGSCKCAAETCNSESIACTP